MIDPGAIPLDVLGICRRLREAGHAAFVVAGSVRDRLIGRAPADFDVATSTLPEATLGIFGARYAIPTGLQHGTVTVLAGKEQRHVEVTTFHGGGAHGSL